MDTKFREAVEAFIERAGLTPAIVNNSKVNEQIEARQTALPLQVEPGASQILDRCFPVAPSPLEVRVEYGDPSGGHTIGLDTRDALNGLHLLAETDAAVE